MKLRVLISILFIIATTFTALHEIEHISGKHDSSSCQICIVDDHSVSCDIIDDICNSEIIIFPNEIPSNLVSSIKTRVKTNQSRAPPKIS